MRLIDANALEETFRKTYKVNGKGVICAAIDEAPTVEAIPIEWLTAQAENPSNSDAIRNALDYIVYTLWAERKDE